jgi:hypothetical protein
LFNEIALMIHENRHYARMTNSLNDSGIVGNPKQLLLELASLHQLRGAVSAGRPAIGGSVVRSARSHLDHAAASARRLFELPLRE